MNVKRLGKRVVKRHCVSSSFSGSGDVGVRGGSVSSVERRQVERRQNVGRESRHVTQARGASLSSSLWLQRQFQDPYVAEARRHGYRSRSAFKLLEIDRKLRILKPGQRVVDLGAAPGGWTQVAVASVGSLDHRQGGSVLAVDLNAWTPVKGATCLTCDFMAHDSARLLKQALRNGKANVILSDMSPNTTGHQQTDQLRILALVEAAYAFALDVLSPGGSFVSKVFQSGAAPVLLSDMKQHFTAVRHIKPPASRKDSAEIYLVAQGYQI